MTTKRARSRPPQRAGFDERRIEPTGPDSKEKTAYLIAQVARFQATLYAQRIAGCGVSLAGAFLLLELGQEEPLTHSDLATRLSIAHATVAQTLRRLERDDFVTRSLHEADRRRVFVRLTERGRAVCAPLLREGEVLEEEIRETLGAEGAAQLHRSLTLLTQRWQTPRG